jgi:voltage-dependent calcium channel L type alpha-1D
MAPLLVSPRHYSGEVSFITLCLIRFRVFCWRVQAHPICGNLILVCIIVSSAFLACEDPLRAKAEINQVL